MRNESLHRLLVGAGISAVVLTFVSTTSAQQFVSGSGQLPSLGSATEATKFGDFDLDGDLDLVYANGGDNGNQQSRLLVNNGLAQAGTIGTYTDVTATNLLPNFTQSSRDVQIVDIDNDGDLDFYFSNHSQQTTQSNTWFINQGGAQAGTAGTFQRDMTRWFEIGTNGSSLPAAQLINTGSFAGGFQDWSCQCDFSDVDLDGDSDLLHTSYGSGFNALVMTRLFLNGGGTAPLGFFKEYNPSLAVSPNPNLNTGNAAGWVEGTHLNNTTDVTGVTHDITNMALDADFADMDGDFDNDIYGNSRDTRQRMYQNRFFENGGTLGSEGAGTRLYRDVANSWIPTLTDADSNYDGDLNDMDNDNAVDGYFLNGGSGTTDVWMTNGGNGVLGHMGTVPSSGNDDNEIDWHDYDNDGDIDPIISAFRGNDRFYKNNFVETGLINLTLVSIASGQGAASLAADVGDCDNDGDLDLIFAEDASVNEVLLINTLNVPDPIAPRVPHLQQLPNGGPQSDPRRIIARAFDNTDLEYFRHAVGVLNFTVNGEPHTAPAVFTGGNLFRANLPGYWTGAINYSVSVTDRKGNTGTSPTLSVTISSAGLSNYGSGTPGCSGPEVISANSAPTVPNPDFALKCTNAPPSSLGLGLVGDVQSLGSDPLGLGVNFLVDLFGSTFLTATNFTSDPLGNAVAPTPIPDNPSIVGAVLYAQGIFAWSAGPCSPSPFNLSSSNGIQITLLP